MTSRKVPLLTLTIAALIITLGMLAGFCADIRGQIKEATKGFKDITVTAKVVYGNKKELAKIGKEFARSYEVETTTIKYKSPDKMRVAGKLGMVGFAVVRNGCWKAYMVPSLHINKKDDCTKEPHKLQGELDVGIVTEQLWRDYIIEDAHVEKASSGDLYKITFRRSNSLEKKLTCWVEAKGCKLLKLDKYESDGSMKCRYIFSKHKEVGGVWVPLGIDVYNEDSKLAGTTEYSNIKVNSGIPDSEFKL